MKGLFTFAYSIFLVLILCQYSLSSCDQGCLACSVDSANNFSCTVCDSYNFYFKNPDTKKCYKNFIPKCEVPSSNLLCMVCDPGYVLDETMGVCATVSDSSIVTNCKRYSNNKSCIECDEKYFIDGSACSAVTDELSNCMTYSSATECASCKEGYYLVSTTDNGVTTQECKSFSSSSNCKKYSFGECQQCKTSFQMNKNYFLEQMISENLLQDKLNLLKTEAHLSDTQGSVCVSSTTSHCQENDSSVGTCVKCSSGYYLNPSTSECVPNPEDSITNCMNYQNSGTCSKCKHSYYLSNNECLEVTKIENCLIYNPTSNECLECKSEYFFNSGACTPRNNIIIPSCSKLSLSADVCDVCDDNHTISSDKLKCFYNIDNCGTAEENTGTAGKADFYCSNCNLHYYPSADGSLCLKQFVSNCSVYTLNVNECQTCIQNYYLNNNECLTTWLPDCLTPNPSDNSKCDTCRDGFFVNQTSFQCQIYTVSNCVRSPTSDVCTSCHTGPSSEVMFFMEDDRCYPLNLLGCETPSTTDNTCTNCATGYTSNGNGGCYKIPIPHCSAIDTSGNCTACSPSTEFYLNTTTNSCERFTAKNCLTYESNADQCDDCLNGDYFKNSDNLCLKYNLNGCDTKSAAANECTSSGCADGFYFDTNSKLCFPSTFSDDFCETASTTDNTCTTCLTTDFNGIKIYKNTDGVCVHPNVPGCTAYDANNDCTTCAVGYFLDGTSCVPHTAVNCATPTTSTSPFTGTVCATCPLGYNDTVKDTLGSCYKNSIIGCKTYDASNDCTECKKGFHLDSAVCKLNSDFFCLDYDSSGNCTKCFPGYNLSSATPPVCEALSAADCLIYKRDDDTCHLCAKTHYLDSSNVCQTFTPQDCQRREYNNLNCLACVPGKMLVAASNVDNCLTDSTVYIDQNCLESNNGTTGLCTKCKNNKHLVSSANIVHIPGCIKADSDGKCLMCAPFHSLSSGECTLATAITNCAQIKEMTDVTSTTGTIDATVTECAKLVNNQTHYLVSGTPTSIASVVTNCLTYKPSDGSCLACEKGYINSSDGTACEAISSTSVLIANCEFYALGSTTNCYQCKSDYAVASDSLSCIAISRKNLLNCKKLELNNLVCSECNDGFAQPRWASNTGGTGVKYCISWDYLLSETEAIFTESVNYFAYGYKMKSYYENHDLIEIPEDDPCARYIDSDCVKCKAPGTIPKLVSDNGKMLKEYECVPFDNSESLVGLQLKKQADGTYKLVPPEKLSSGVVYVGEGFFLNNDVDTNVCASSMNQDIACEEKEFNVCTKCANGFYKNLNNPSECLPLNIENCSKNNDRVCLECNSQYYLNNTLTTSPITQTCTLRTVDSCLVFSKTSDTCLQCHEGFYLNVTANPNNPCVKSTKLNCIEISPWSDYCIKCASGYVNSYGNCVEETGLVCKTYFNTPNYCVANFADCFNTADSCAVCNKQCLECPDGTFYSDGICLNYTVENCQKFHAYNNQCETCQPGYYLNDVLDCEESQLNDCLEYHPFLNKCVKCAEGTYEKEGVCYPYSVSNCQVFSPFRNACDSCSTGFYLNEGKDCDEYTESSCQVFHTTMDACVSCIKGFYLDEKSCKGYTIDNCIVFHPQQNFCLLCNDGFVQDNTGNCVYQAIDYCEVYYQHIHGCSFCREGYYTGPELNCLPHTKLNCEVASETEDKCIKCQDGFYIENNQCSQYTVENCFQYNPFQNKCLNCLSGFFYDDGLCHSYDLANCALSNSFEDICSMCNEGYYLGTDRKCYRLSSPCKVSDPYNDACVSCAPDYHLDDVRHCMPNMLDNCLEYVPDENKCAVCEKDHWIDSGICSNYFAKNCKSFKTNEDLCEECESNMFYKNTNGICLPITKVLNCETYSSSADECSECKEGFYLFSSTECKSNPVGIQNCKEYKDIKTCSKCKFPYYLLENKCLQSSTSDSNCAEYLSDGICGKCISSKILSFNNTCDDPVNTTCTEYADKDNCSLCSQGEVLKKDDNDKMTCVASGLSNCAQAELSGTNIVCKLCENGYLLESDECVSPDTSIDKCLQYESQTKCSLCDTGFLLATDQLSCVTNDNKIPSDCLYGKLNSNPICYECDPGYWFDSSGSCVKCGGDGCDICSPNGEKCKLCAKGYYMNTQMNCEQYQSSTTSKIASHKHALFESSSNLSIFLTLTLLKLLF